MTEYVLYFRLFTSSNDCFLLLDYDMVDENYFIGVCMPFGNISFETIDHILGTNSIDKFLDKFFESFDKQSRIKYFSTGILSKEENQDLPDYVNNVIHPKSIDQVVNTIKDIAYNMKANPPACSTLLKLYHLYDPAAIQPITTAG